MAALNRTLTFASDAETTRFAQALAPLLEPGDTVLLQGDLGSGKTHFARAVIQQRLAAAGLAEDVPSPTFTLVQVYDDKGCEIWHCDLYRLGGPSEVVELGLTEAFETAICLVEWPDRLQDLRPRDALLIDLAMTPRKGERSVRLHADATRWSAVVGKALDAFRAG